MTTMEIKTIKLEADEGKILTDGQIYGSIIFLGANRTSEEFYEITKEEYENTLKDFNGIAEEDIVDNIEIEVYDNE